MNYGGCGNGDIIDVIVRACFNELGPAIGVRIPSIRSPVASHAGTRGNFYDCQENVDVTHHSAHINPQYASFPLPFLLGM